MSVSRSMPAFVIAVLLSTVAAAENWPQWRGPGGQGISSEPGIPTDWQPDRNVLWKVPVAPGHSSPAVWGDRLFVTAGYPDKKVIALRPGVVPAAERVVWEYSKGTGYVISNILYGDYLYLVTDTGIVTCLDPKTGAVKYEGGRVPVPARFTGSPVAFGGYVALTSQDGDTFMLKAGPSHEVVRTNAVGEPVMSSPAIANGRIYIRGQQHLFAIGG
jgi:outer membrane protein assembly factor BamB